MPSQAHQSNIAEIKRFIAALFPLGETFEIRIPNCKAERGYYIRNNDYPTVVSGFFDNQHNAAVEVQGCNGIHPYITVNPVSPDFLARSNSNRLTRIKKGEAAEDRDILHFNWIFSDIDPNKKDDKVSATDEERAKAIRLRDLILAENPEIARCSLFGTSGNGGWITTFLDGMANTPENVKKIQHFLKTLDARYSGDLGKVDTSTYNPSRIMSIAGTVKCKGTDRPDRPWRVCTFDSPDGFRPGIFGLETWLGEHGRAIPIDPPAPPIERDPGRVAAHKEMKDFSPDKIVRRAQAYIEKMAPGIEGNHGSDQTFDAACSLIKGFDLSIHAAWPLLIHYNKRCVPPWDDVALWRKLEQADAKPDDRPRGYLIDAGKDKPKPVRKAPQRDPETGGVDGKPPVFAGGGANGRDLPEIECRDVSLYRVRREAIESLERANDPPQIFNFAENLSWIKESKGGVDEVYVQPIRPFSLRNIMAESARYIQTYVTKKDSFTLEIFPPESVVNAVLNDKQWSGKMAPPLELVVSTPRFVKDGRYIDTPGYDEDSRIYYRPIEGVDLSGVPERPTGEEVRAAVEFLTVDYLGDFPFEDAASRANAMGCMLLPFVRTMFAEATPLHVFEASTEGTGKSKLAHACAFPSIGRELSSTSQKEDEAEWRKMLSAKLMEGSSHIFIDNLKDPRDHFGGLQPIDSGQLAKALTEPIWEDRLIGFGTMVKIRVKSVWMASGNNLEWSKELGRRIVPIRLQVPSENPSERTGFRCAPLELEDWAAIHREKLIRCCLIICRAWIAAGMPRGRARFGSYQEYASIVGGILETAGIAGFLENRAKEQNRDRESTRWPAFVETWHKTFGNEDVSANDLFTMVWGGIFPEGGVCQADEDLQVAFADVFGSKNDIGKKQRIGHALLKQEGRVYGNWRITKREYGQRGKGNIFALVPITPEVNGTGGHDLLANGSGVNGAAKGGDRLFY